MRFSMKKVSVSYTFAKKAMANSIKESIKKGKNPFSGRKFTKAQQKELVKLSKAVK